MFLLLFQIFNKQQAQEPERDYSEFSDALDKGEISEVLIQGNVIRGRFQSGEPTTVTSASKIWPVRLMCVCTS